jgi:hypothetical protein
VSPIVDIFIAAPTQPSSSSSSSFPATVSTLSQEPKKHRKAYTIYSGCVENWRQKKKAFNDIQLQTKQQQQQKTLNGWIKDVCNR